MLQITTTPIQTEATNSVATGLALADWARAEIAKQRGPRPTIELMHNTRPATAEQRKRTIADFLHEMRTRDAAADWDRAVMALIREAAGKRA